ncbi:MAG: hypothetical protein QM503_13345 [Bacteroidota bacterium]
MKTATVKHLKLELGTLSSDELLEICLRLSKFKKENKELLTYLLFEASDEAAYVRNVKSEIKQQFEEINTDSYYYIKKSVRKILRKAKTHIRYSKKKETEVEILIYFCSEMKRMEPTINNNVVLVNIFNRQLEIIEKAMSYLHEDLRYDYGLEIDMLMQ